MIFLPREPYYIEYTPSEDETDETKEKDRKDKKEKLIKFGKTVFSSGKKIAKTTGETVGRNITATIREVKQERKRRRIYPYGSPRIYRAPRGVGKRTRSPPKKIFDNEEKIFFSSQLGSYNFFNDEKTIDLIGGKNLSFFDEGKNKKRRLI